MAQGNNIVELFLIQDLDKNETREPKRERRPPFTFSSGAVYEGEWRGNVREGWGTQIWPDGAKYEGILD